MGCAAELGSGLPLLPRLPRKAQPVEKVPTGPLLVQNKFKTPKNRILGAQKQGLERGMKEFFNRP
jgi:hypothetical protein